MQRQQQKSRSRAKGSQRKQPKKDAEQITEGTKSKENASQAEAAKSKENASQATTATQKQKEVITETKRKSKKIKQKMK